MEQEAKTQEERWRQGESEGVRGKKQGDAGVPLYCLEMFVTTLLLWFLIFPSLNNIHSSSKSFDCGGFESSLRSEFNTVWDGERERERERERRDERWNRIVHLETSIFALPLQLLNRLRSSSELILFPLSCELPATGERSQLCFLPFLPLSPEPTMLIRYLLWPR